MNNEELVIKRKKVFETYDYIKFDEFLQKIEELKKIKSVGDVPIIRIKRDQGGLNSLWFDWTENEKLVIKRKKVFETYDYIKFDEFLEKIEELKKIKSVGGVPIVRIKRHQGGLNSLWFDWTEYEEKANKE